MESQTGELGGYVASISPGGGTYRNSSLTKALPMPGMDCKFPNSSGERRNNQQARSLRRERFSQFGCLVRSSCKIDSLDCKDYLEIRKATAEKAGNLESHRPFVESARRRGTMAGGSVGVAWLNPRRLAVPVLFVLVLAWLWPIGLGGKMPVGGDVTQFSLGLMAELSRSLKAWRLPLWNDLWGFGFPGVGESQMGVYYPPHWLLYGLLEPEVGYAWSLVLHTLWGSLGAYWAARRFGVSRTGAVLTGFSWSTCGFFLIHLSHQWGYTVGSWMPWAWGLAWSASRGEGKRRDPFWLAVVLSVSSSSPVIFSWRSSPRSARCCWHSGNVWRSRADWGASRPFWPRSELRSCLRRCSSGRPRGWRRLWHPPSAIF